MAEAPPRRRLSFHLPSKSRFLLPGGCPEERDPCGAHTGPCGNQPSKADRMAIRGEPGTVKLACRGSKPLLLRPTLSLPGRNRLSFAKSSVLYERLEPCVMFVGHSIHFVACSVGQTKHDL